MTALRTDLLVEQGTTWSRGWQPLLRTDPDQPAAPFLDDTWAARSQVRQSANATTVLHEWSTQTGNAVIDAPTGVVVLSLTAAESTAWAWTSAVYDLEVSKNGVTYRIAEGKLTVRQEVTR